MHEEVLRKAQLAKVAAPYLAGLGQNEKNAILLAIAQGLEDNATEILSANERDLAEGSAKGLSSAMLDRLALSVDRISGIAGGLRKVTTLADPVGEVIRMWQRPNGLQIGQMRVPIGVIAMIYESRPNATIDATGLCLKSGNAVILKGGKEAVHSNIALISVAKRAVERFGLPEGAFQLIESTDREATHDLMKMREYVDLLIPRGSKSLNLAVAENSNIPTIFHGDGNCHVYVDADCKDFDQAVKIVINGKCSRPAVCNATEKLLVHREVAERFIPQVVTALKAAGVEVRGDAAVCTLVPDVVPTAEADWSTEYLDLIIAIKVVDSLDQAICHINQYGSKHTDVILTDAYSASRRFTQEVDSAVVLVNASTRFTDGEEFGFGAEIGISTVKLHARGPMGLTELTTTKYVVFGNGQIR